MIRKLILFFIPVLLFGCVDNVERSLQKVDEGVEMMYRMKKERAKKLFEEAIRINPDNYEAYYYLGAYYMDKRNYKKAIELYDKAIEKDSAFANAYYARGEARFYSHDREGACADWKLAAKYGRPNMEDKLKHCN